MFSVVLTLFIIFIIFIIFICSLGAIDTEPTENTETVYNYIFKESKTKEVPNNKTETDMKPIYDERQEDDYDKKLDLYHDKLYEQYRYIQSIAKKSGLDIAEIKNAIYTLIKDVLDSGKRDNKLFSFMSFWEKEDTIPTLEYWMREMETLNECYTAFCKYAYFKYEFIVLAFKLYNIKFNNDLKIKLFETFETGSIEKFQEETLNSAYAKVYNMLDIYCKATHLNIPYDYKGVDEIDRVYQGLTKASFFIKVAFAKELSDKQTDELYKICEDVLLNNMNEMS